MKSNVTLYLNKDKTEVVEEGSRDAAFLLVRAGKEMSESDMDVYGQGLGAKAKALVAAQGGSKGRTAPPEDKSMAPGENKDEKVEGQVEDVDLEAMKKAELIAFAEEHEIDLGGAKSNDEIRAAIEAASGTSEPEEEAGEVEPE